MPKFSICIPTWNRSRYLYWTLQTILAQSFQDYEIVISDNFSDDDTFQMIDKLNSPKIRYYHTGKPIAPVANWENAVRHALGERIILVGSDDGMLPYCLEAVNFLMDYYKAPILRWNRIYYCWNDPTFQASQNQITLQQGGSNWLLTSQKVMREVASWKMDYTMLPMFYTACVDRELVDKLISKTGQIFWGSSADLYSGFAFAALVDKYISFACPMTINSTSALSLGCNSNTDAKWVRDIQQLSREAGYTAHPKMNQGDSIGDFGMWLKSAFYWAKEKVLPDVELEPSDGSTDRNTIPCYDGKQTIFTGAESKVNNVMETAQFTAQFNNWRDYSLELKEW
jgi:glycosyltransferase involved in cell wall biosynthesis